ncbi:MULTISPECIES: hypothetical protein [unclassified Nocardioides]|uniref:hypothetical protein n=1 Tax=unclassified Nocardioides TaxID=2615069 RepID=UPI00114FA32D|nr:MULTISPECIES: hypothetical protein [unclassified Nocardioides]WGY01454.1 hypothetical protein QI633_23320 [Nocardioides sp. QY071]
MPPMLVVPLTVRSRTADGADIRLLLEADVDAAGRASAAELERVAFAIVVPAVEEAVRRRELAALAADPTAGLDHIGGALLRVRVVAVEHLIVSPSADPDGSRPHGRG